uniref:Type II CAAX prenyl endopeptidase Rce1 family protein n=1 Tax=Desertifilum tharense IPPAS B-1220 TaxID=1781255 RepID=A0ACD5GTY9_9CYAN
MFLIEPFVSLSHRFVAALTTIPNASAWGVAAALLGVYTLIALPIGFQFGFIQRDTQTSPKVIRDVLLLALISPALSEELFFRVLLLPHSSEGCSLAVLGFWGIAGLIVFILYHPLNGISFFPAGRQTFFNPVFLGLAALLGIICTLAYWHSGSICTRRCLTLDCGGGVVVAIWGIPPTPPGISVKQQV